MSRVEGFEFRIQGLGIMVQGLVGFRVWKLGCKVVGFGVGISSHWLRNRAISKFRPQRVVLGRTFAGKGLGFRVDGFIF